MIKATKEQLENLILVDNLPYTVIAKQFEVSDNTIRKWARDFSIELPKRKILIDTKLCPSCQKEFKPKDNGRGGHTNCCSVQCAADLKSKQAYEDYKNDNSIAFERRNLQYFKKYFIEEQNHKCSICGMEDIWNNKFIVFVLDHIDGNADNNERNNLRLVCPNCDSQLDTFKSKNKKSARSKYRKT